VLLFVATSLTTTVAGAFYANENLLEKLFAEIPTIDSLALVLLRGCWFSVPLMMILLAHEMGHYLAGRRHFLDVTLPYFIPAPPPVGTFGAFIRIRSAITDRRVLIQVGACGPISGSLVAIPMLMLGLLLSDVSPTKEPAAGMALGSSLILEICSLIRFGHLTWDANVILHPIALAAWFGLFVTAMNLLPIGQLDGGHVVYALFGPRWARIVSIVALVSLIPLGIVFWPGWFVFGLLAILLGMKHPPPIDSMTPLDRTGLLIGYAAILLFVLTFIPVPVSFLD
jgi:membrane-associated protease RseP (regulator of RpoE activity)